MRVSSAPDGWAFDSNLLGKQTQRRLMALWMETARAKVLILPRVMDELCLRTRGAPEHARYRSPSKYQVDGW